MAGGRDNLTGEWSGQFSYPSNAGPITPFLAHLRDDGGKLSGTIIEPDVFYGGPTLEASLNGLRHGNSVDFTKSYALHARRGGYKNPIDYVGSVSSDGNTISGVWSLRAMDGTFEMHRDAEASEDIEHEVQVELPVAVPAR
jgi:hypothetical protein